MFVPSIDPDTGSVCRYDSCFSSVRLTVVSPPSLSGPMGYVPNLSSPAITGTGNLTGRIVWPHSADGIYGCAPLSRSITDDGTPIAGNILMISAGGGCTNAAKYVILQATGANLIILWDNVQPITYAPQNIGSFYFSDFSRVFLIPR